jgi:hypothetical protein
MPKLPPTIAQYFQYSRRMISHTNLPFSQLESRHMLQYLNHFYKIGSDCSIWKRPYQYKGLSRAVTNKHKDVADFFIYADATDEALIEKVQNM